MTGRPSCPRLNEPAIIPDAMYSPHLREGMRFYVQVLAAPTQRWGLDSDYDHTHVLTTIANAFCLRDQTGAELTSFGIQGFSSQGSLPVRKA